MRYFIVFSFIIIVLLWKACDSIFTCGYKIVDFIDSPSGSRTVVSVYENCGVLGGFSFRYYLVNKDFAKNLDVTEKTRNDLPFWRMFLREKYGRNKIQWLSETELNVIHEEPSVFYKQSSKFSGVTINYILHAEDPLLVQQIVDACPLIIEDLWGDEPDLILDMVSKDTQRAHKMVNPQNYHEMTKLHGEGTDFVCTAYYLPFKGRRVVVRVSEDAKGRSIRAILAEEWNTAVVGDPPEVIWRS